MKPNSHFSEGAAPRSERNLVRWTPMLRYVALIVVAGVSTGCADDVVMHLGAAGCELVPEAECDLARLPRGGLR